MSAPEDRAAFLHSHVRLGKLKDAMREATKAHKVLEQQIHSHLDTAAGAGGFQLGQYLVKFKTRRKAMGQLKLPVVGAGYVGFQRAHGRLDVSEEEKMAFQEAVLTLQRSAPRPETQIVNVSKIE